jgi:hypothetical protein
MNQYTNRQYGSVDGVRRVWAAPHSAGAPTGQGALSSRRSIDGIVRTVQVTGPTLAVTPKERKQTRNEAGVRPVVDIHSQAAPELLQQMRRTMEGIISLPKAAHTRAAWPHVG